MPVSESRVGSSGATVVNGITTITNHQSVQDYFSTKLSAAKKPVPVEAEPNEECIELLGSGDCERLKKGKRKKRTQKTS